MGAKAAVDESERSEELITCSSGVIGQGKIAS